MLRPFNECQYLNFVQILELDVTKITVSYGLLHSLKYKKYLKVLSNAHSL